MSIRQMKAHEPVARFVRFIKFRVRGDQWQVSHWNPNAPGAFAYESKTGSDVVVLPFYSNGEPHSGFVVDTVYGGTSEAAQIGVMQSGEVVEWWEKEEFFAKFGDVIAD